MSVYTRTGDKGKTALYGGKRVSKASTRVDAYGSIDELNSAIGVAIAEIQSSNYSTDKKVQSLEQELIRIQNDLFEIGGALANPGSKIKLTKRVTDFENTINKLEKDLPPLSNFILPGGGRSGSCLHLSRTVARRAERRIVDLSEKEKVQNEIIIYMNRLSDLLFMFARFVNHKEKKKEIVWSKR